MFAAISRFFASLIIWLGVFDKIALSVDNLAGVGLAASKELAEDAEFKRTQRALERARIATAVAAAPLATPAITDQS